jgi:hypothetical protein
MKLRHAYWLFCIPGLLLPYAVFMPWLLEHGLDIPQTRARAATIASQGTCRAPASAMIRGLASARWW